MRTILTLVAKDFRLFWKDKMYVALTFFVPMGMIMIFGMIFGGGGGGDPTGINMLVVDEAQSETSVKLIELLKEEDTFAVHTHKRQGEDEWVPMDRAHAENLIHTNAGAFRYALILPEDLLDEDFGFNMELLYNPQNQIENSIVQGMLQKTLFSQGFQLLMNNPEYGITEDIKAAFDSDMSKIIAQHFGGDAEDILAEMQSESFWGFGGGDSESDADSDSDTDSDSEEDEEDDFMGGMFNFEKTQVFGKGKNPMAQSVGGWSVMFLLFSLTGAASSLFEERDRGLFLRLLSGLSSRAQILWSKFIHCASLGMLQMIVLMAFGEIVFDIITSPAQIFPLVVISIFTVAAATSFGMLLSSIATTPAQANGMGTFFILAMSAFGGAMFPLFMMPEFIRNYISPFSLVYWAMDGILAVLWRDAGVFGMLPQLGVLGGIAIVILWISLWRFNRGDLFR
ncbi:MAG: ABC transporter permease [Puniceicoccaceae bacterium]